MATVIQRVEKLFHLDVIPTSWGRKIRLWHVIPFTLAAVVAVWMSGLRFSWGPSMGDTLRGIYRFEKGKNPEIGQIVVFNQPNRSLKTTLWPSAKRVVRMSKEGVELRGDDHDRAEDSTDFGLVPKESIIGTIVWVSTHSDFDRWLKLNEPHWWGAKKAETSEYIIFELGDYLDVVSKIEEKRIARISGQFVDFNGSLLSYRSGRGSFLSFDPSTGKEELIQTALALTRTDEEVELIVRNDGQTFFGPTYILVDKSLSKKAKLRIKGMTYSLQGYHEFDYDPVLKTAISSFNLTPRDDSVPSGTLTATVVSGEP